MLNMIAKLMVKVSSVRNVRRGALSRLRIGIRPRLRPGNGMRLMIGPRLPPREAR